VWLRARMMIMTRAEKVVAWVFLARFLSLIVVYEGMHAIGVPNVVLCIEDRPPTTPPPCTLT
jgi:hypothetical protein